MTEESDGNDLLNSVTDGELRQAVDHLHLVEASRARYPELVRKVRPTVTELVRQAKSIRKFLGLPRWPEEK